MARVNLLLWIATIACALGVVTSQHKARKLFVELQKEKDLAQQMDVEWGQLQLEQSTWAMPARVEKVAAMKLEMQPAPAARVRTVHIEQGAPRSHE